MGDNKGLQGNVVLVSPAKGNQAIKINVPGGSKETTYRRDADGRYRYMPTGKLFMNNVSLE